MAIECITHNDVLQNIVDPGDVFNDLPVVRYYIPNQFHFRSGTGIDCTHFINPRMVSPNFLCWSNDLYSCAERGHPAITTGGGTHFKCSCKHYLSVFNGNPSPSKVAASNLCQMKGTRQDEVR